MRNAWFFLLLLVALAAGVGAVYPYLRQPQQEGTILVRVRGTHVRFRSSPPPSLEEPNVVRYVESRETFLAINRFSGFSEILGQPSDWYHLVNTATRERGWVAGTYVEPLDPLDTLKLKQLGTSPVAESPISLVNSLIGIAAGILSIVSTILAILAYQSSHRPLPREAAVPSNVVAFPAQAESPRSQVIFGTSGGSPWLFRPKAPRKGGGRKPA